MIQFGTGGFRGIIADDFCKTTVKLITQAVANIIHQEGSEKIVYVGYDFRFASDEAAIWISNTLAANGIHVVLSDQPTPTPTVMSACKAHHADFGFMVTASHNPYWYNGVKLFQKDGMDADVVLTTRLEKEIASLSSFKTMDFAEAKEKKLIVLENILDPYLANILTFLKPATPKKQIHLLLDPIHGTGAVTLKRLCQSMGIKNTDILHESHDAFFGYRIPNPIKANMMEDADLVRNGHYDLCIGTDSDCDRIAVLDENGNYVDANEILGVLYYYLIRYRGEKGDIIKNLATSNLIDALAKKLGYQCHEVDVGFKNISQGMKDYDALLGGESSGGLTMRGYLFGKDSTFASALFLEMIEQIGKPVSAILNEMKEFACFHQIIQEDSVIFKDRTKVFDYAKTHLPAFPQSGVTRKPITNNFKYYFANGDWALLRFSGTEPLVRLFAETASEADGKEDIQAIRQMILEAEK